MFFVQLSPTTNISALSHQKNLIRNPRGMINKYTLNMIINPSNYFNRFPGSVNNKLKILNRSIQEQEKILSKQSKKNQMSQYLFGIPSRSNIVTNEERGAMEKIKHAKNNLRRAINKTKSNSVTVAMRLPTSQRRQRLLKKSENLMNLMPLLRTIKDARSLNSIKEFNKLYKLPPGIKKINNKNVQKLINEEFLSKNNKNEINKLVTKMRKMIK